METRLGVDHHGHQQGADVLVGTGFVGRDDERSAGGVGQLHADVLVGQVAEDFEQERGLEADLHLLAVILAGKRFVGGHREAEVLGRNGEFVEGELQADLVRDLVGAHGDTFDDAQQVGAADDQFVVVVLRDDAAVGRVVAFDQAAHQDVVAWPGCS